MGCRSLSLGLNCLQGVAMGVVVGGFGGGASLFNFIQVVNI